MTDPLTTAVRNLATTIAQNDAIQALGLQIDENYMNIVDGVLDDLLPLVAQWVDDLGPEGARESLARQFVHDADRSAGLLAAALVRLAGAR